MLRFAKVAACAAISSVVLWGGLSLMEPRVDACIHPGKTFEFPLKAGAQRGVIFFNNGREELVLRPSYKVEIDEAKLNADGTLPGLSQLAWIVPVPSLPDRYVEAEEKLVDDLQKFAAIESDAKDWQKGADARQGGPEKGEANGAELLEAVQVGNYKIQPIKATGEKGGTELNAWLDDNGFGRVSESVLKFYLNKGHFWLAVKLSKEGGLPANGTVKPLQISFASDKPVYPLKINAGRGVIDLEMWLFCNQKLDAQCLDAYGMWLTETEKSMGRFSTQKNRETEYSKLPETARKVLDGGAEKQADIRALKEGKLYCYRIWGENMDADGKLAKLESDLEFKFEAVK